GRWWPHGHSFRTDKCVEGSRFWIVCFRESGVEKGLPLDRGTMMKQRIVCCAAMLVVGAGAASALADGRVTVTDATGDYNGSDGSGGAFTVTRATPQA